MGLDMYVEGHVHYRTAGPLPVPEGAEGVEENKADPQVKRAVYDIGYFRKHPDLHGYIVQTYADGKDECQEIALSKEDIQNILDANEKDAFPYTTGFFFGQSRPEDKTHTKEVFERALIWLDTPLPPGAFFKQVVYQASW